MQNLVTAARRAGVGHIVYVSIVGIDRIPLPYYKTKLRVERALEASGVGHTVLRATQFHDLINTMFSIQRFSPLLWTLRGVRFQPIDTRDVAVAARRTDRHANRPGGSPTSAALPCTRTPIWHAYTSRPAAAVDPSSRCRVPGRIVGGYRVGRESGAGQPGRHHRLRRIPRRDRIKFAWLSASP